MSLDPRTEIAAMLLNRVKGKPMGPDWIAQVPHVVHPGENVTPTLQDLQAAAADVVAFMNQVGVTIDIAVQSTSTQHTQFRVAFP